MQENLQSALGPAALELPEAKTPKAARPVSLEWNTSLRRAVRRGRRVLSSAARVAWSVPLFMMGLVKTERDIDTLVWHLDGKDARPA